MTARGAAGRGGAWPLALWIAAMLIAAFALATGGGLRTDLTAFMPQSKSESDRLLVSLLREGPAARRILMGIERDGIDARALAALTRDFSAALRAAGDFTRVAFGEPPDFDGADLLFRYRYLLSDAGETRGAEADPFSEAALRAALEQRLTEIASGFAVLDKSQLAADPTAAFGRLLVGMAPGGGPERTDGVWMSNDGRRALLVAETSALGYDLDGQTRAVERARSAFEHTAGGGARLLMSGPATFAVASSRAVRSEATLLGIAASVLLVGLLFMVYGSARLVLIGAVPVVSGMLIGAATVSYVFDGIHGITLAFGITLLGVTLDYPLHVFSHATGGATLESSARVIWPTLRLGAATSVLAFASLGLSRFAGMAELALFAACGIVAAGATTRYVLPALVAREWRKAKTLPKMLTHGSGRGARARMLRLVLAILLAGASGLFSVQLARSANGTLWENDLAALSPVPAASVALDRGLRAELGAPDVRHALVLRATSMDAVLELSESLTPALERLRESGVIGGYDAPSRYLPSPARQLERRGSLPDGATLADRLRTAQAGLPFRPDAFVPFLEDVEATRTLEPLGFAELAGTPLGLRLRSMRLGGGEHSDGGSDVAMLIHLSGVNDGGTLGEWAREALDGASARYVDIKQASDRAVSGYRNDALRLLGLAVPLLALVLWLGTRSLRRVGACAGAIAIAVVVDLGLLATLGTRLSVFHLIAAVLVAGIGLDYALFFSRPNDDAAAHARTLHAVCVCALSTILVFGLLATSALPVLRAIGVTVALGVALAFLSTLLVTREWRGPPEGPTDVGEVNDHAVRGAR